MTTTTTRPSGVYDDGNGGRRPRQTRLAAFEQPVRSATTSATAVPTTPTAVGLSTTTTTTVVETTTTATKPSGVQDGANVFDVLDDEDTT